MEQLVRSGLHESNSQRYLSRKQVLMPHEPTILQNMFFNGFSIAMVSENMRILIQSRSTRTLIFLRDLLSAINSRLYSLEYLIAQGSGVVTVIAEVTPVLSSSEL